MLCLKLFLPVSWVYPKHPDPASRWGSFREDSPCREVFSPRENVVREPWEWCFKQAMLPIDGMDISRSLKKQTVMLDSVFFRHAFLTKATVKWSSGCPGLVCFKQSNGRRKNIST